ncbi:E3 SUMO-protein ligase NSE2 [Nymphon striatum]|nr:E3 SUMO-protein ligase NSE2 [Nymphon striatum]
MDEMARLEKQLEAGMTATHTIMQDVSEVGEVSDDKSRVLKSTMSEYVKMMKNLGNYMSAVNAIQKQLENQTCSDDISIDSMIQSKVKKVSDAEVSNDPRMKDFLSLLNNGKDGGTNNGKTAQGLLQESSQDEDMLLDQAEVVTKDPITQKDMIIPVTNKLCKHNYDRESIINYMNSKANARCPFAGCPNKTVLKENHLEINLILKKHIGLKQKKFH